MIWFGEINVPEHRVLVPMFSLASLVTKGATRVSETQPNRLSDPIAVFSDDVPPPAKHEVSRSPNKPARPRIPAVTLKFPIP